MSIEELSSKLPEYAKDLKLNLSSVLQQTELTAQQLWGTAVATAIAARNDTLLRAVVTEAEKHLSPQALHASKAAAAIMGMNNIYYRFQHFIGKPEYKAIPARLRMQAIRMHGSDPVDFELWCAAVSAVNGCQACVSAHEHVLREKGITEEQVVAAIKIAAVMNAVAGVLDTEAALA
ncbi:MAG: carboxymuconolactone decarboxylase family protein [Bryobacterales bacterium]|nr:carboxymuconolactone decarboxylase family protein [Bryobacterales bacterium]